MCGIPRTPQDPKKYTLVVCVEPNCPDRSWWVAHVGQHKTKRRHRSGKRGSSPHAKRDTGTERKKRRASNKDKPRALDREKPAQRQNRFTPPLPRATPLHSVALPAANAY